MELHIDRLAIWLSAALLLAGCSKAPEPEVLGPERRLEDPEYVRKLDVERSEQNRIQCALEEVRQAREALKAEDPELAGEQAKALDARQAELLQEFDASRRRAAATVRDRIHKDIQNGKIKATNLQKKKGK